MRRVDWLTPREAAHRLGVSVSTVRRLTAADVLDPEPRSGPLRVSTTSVTRYVAEEARWVTRAQAAQMLGLTVHGVAQLGRKGLVATRCSVRGRPSVLREDVEALVENGAMESHE